MTRVYLAWDRRRDCRIALKILRPDFLGSVTWQRFRREIEITRALSHPSVMDLYDSGELESAAHSGSTYSYFSLPCLEGTPPATPTCSTNSGWRMRSGRT